MKKTAPFFIKDAFGFGWAMFREKFGFIVGILLLSGLCMLLPSITGLVTSNRALLFIAQVAASVTGFVIDVGLVHVTLLLRDGKPVKVKDLFARYTIAFRYFVAMVVYCLLICGPVFFFVVYRIKEAIMRNSDDVFFLYDTPILILLIALGIYLAIRYQFYKYFLVDKQLDIVESFKRSNQVTTPHMVQLLRFGAVLLTISFPGYAGFIVYSYPEFFLFSDLVNGIALIASLTLLVAIPVSMLATAYVYRKISVLAQKEDRIEDAEVKIPSFKNQEGVLDNA